MRNKIITYINYHYLLKVPLKTMRNCKPNIRELSNISNILFEYLVQLCFTETFFLYFYYMFQIISLYKEI